MNHQITTAQGQDAAISALDILSEKGLNFKGAKEALLLHKIRSQPDYEPPFTLMRASIQVEVCSDNNMGTKHATVKLAIADKEYISVSEGNGPIDAFDKALKKALIETYSWINDIHLMDYEVSLSNPSKETGADTRVSITTKYGEKLFTTVDVSSDVIEASIMAICDAYELCLNQKGEN